MIFNLVMDPLIKKLERAHGFHIDQEGLVTGQRALEDYTNRLLETIKKKPHTTYNKEPLIPRSRAANFKAHRDLFRTNKRKLAECVIEGLPLGEPKSHPSIQDVEMEYSYLYVTEGPEDHDSIHFYSEGQPDLYRPITTEEIAKAIRCTKSKATGPDGWEMRDMGRIKINTLVILFNSMLFLGFVPSAFRTNRTILIPKKKDSGTKVSDWRPTTISSVFLRTITKIWAWRFEELKTSTLQRGFKRVDGCLLNTITLQEVIKDHRARNAPHTVISLDLRKAFDTVGHSSIFRALKTYGVHEKVREYVAANYREINTLISTPGGTTRPINILRGVKQGDPMSPVLFNLVLDEWLRSLPTEIGLQLGREKIASLAYADDLLLLAENKEDASYLLKRCIKFMEKRGLKINPAKCVALTARRIPAKKKLFSVTKNQFYVDGVAIKQLGIDDFRYLGTQFGHMGILNPSIKELPT